MLGTPSRFDTDKLISGNAGDWFSKTLFPYSRSEVEIRLSTETRPLLAGTKVILALGEESLHKFRPQQSLLLYRGSPIEITGTDVYLIPSIAPQDSFDRRDYESGQDDESDNDKATEKDAQKTSRKNFRFWLYADIRKSIRILGGGVTKYPNVEFIYSPSAEVLLRLMEEWRDGYVCVDIETDIAQNITVFSLLYSREATLNQETKYEVFVIPFKRYDNSLLYSQLEYCYIFKSLNHVFQRNVVVGHNLSFDLFVLCYRYHIIFPLRLFDTMLAHHRCLSGNSSIDTMQGKRLIKDLIGKENFYVWSWKNNSPFPAKVKRVFKTQENVKLVRVHFWKRKFKGIHFDYIDCTPDHRFLIEGKWIEAKDLKKKDSLTRVNTYQINNQGELREMINLGNADIARHVEYSSRYVYEKYHNVILPTELEVHHKDLNPLNNEPDNLIALHSSKHKSIHSKERDYSHLAAQGGWNKDQGLLPKEDLIKYHEAGMSQKEIAEAFNKDQSQISRMFKRYGIKARSLEEAQQLRRRKEKNCRVISVEYLEQPEDVYCMEVEDTNCFSTKGVIVHNCHPEMEKSLAHVISYYLDLPYHKDEGVFNPRNYNQERQLWEYNAKDVWTTWLIFCNIQKEIDKLKARESVSQAMRTLVSCLYMSYDGVVCDTSKLCEIVDKSDFQFEQICRLLKLITKGNLTNPRSPKQIGEYLFQKLGLPIPAVKAKAKNSDKSKGPTGKEALYKLYIKTQLPSIRLILEAKRIAKRASALRELRFWKEDRLTCAYMLTTESFRLKSRSLLSFDIDVEFIDQFIQSFKK